jgi:hypothetical protein
MIGAKKPLKELSDEPLFENDRLGVYLPGVDRLGPGG